MDYATELSPEEVLGRAQAYFAKDWPFGGQYRRFPNEIDCYVEVNRGCLFELWDTLLFILTLTFRGARGPEHQVTKLLAYQREGTTVVSVDADLPEHRTAIDNWVRNELGARPT